MFGMPAKLFSWPIFFVILVVGHGAPLSLLTANWEISVRQCKGWLNVQNTVFLGAPYNVLDVVMDSTTAIWLRR